jgi:hypothetical protein
MSIEQADARALEPYTRTWKEILDERDALRAKVERLERVLRTAEALLSVGSPRKGLEIIRAALKDPGA